MGVHGCSRDGDWGARDVDILVLWVFVAAKWGATVQYVQFLKKKKKEKKKIGGNGFCVDMT